MRFLLVALGLLVMAAAPASAAERITVTDIHNFIHQTTEAINNPNRHVARNFMNRTTADNAVFVNHVAVLNPAAAWQASWYGHPAYAGYYRYPMNPYYAPTSAGTLGKWDQINLLEEKKRTIPGYQANLDVTHTVISPYGTTAVVDIDMKEYSLAYAPYTPSLTARVMHANSKCKMYLTRVGEEDLVMSRMDCNTNTNLPF